MSFLFILVQINNKKTVLLLNHNKVNQRKLIIVIKSK